MRIRAPSTIPVAAAQAIRVQASSTRPTPIARPFRTVRGDVELAESTLADATSVLDRAHEISLSAPRGSSARFERRALGLEVAQMKEHLLGLANQKGSQVYLSGNEKPRPRRSRRPAPSPATTSTVKWSSAPMWSRP